MGYVENPKHINKTNTLTLPLNVGNFSLLTFSFFAKVLNVGNVKNPRTTKTTKYTSKQFIIFLSCCCYFWDYLSPKTFVVSLDFMGS